MPAFPADPPVLSADNSLFAHVIRLTWTPPVPDIGVTLLDYAVTYTRVDPYPTYPPVSFTSADLGWFGYEPFGDPGPPTIGVDTSVDINLIGHDGVLHYFGIGVRTDFGDVWSNVVSSTPLADTPPPPEPTGLAVDGIQFRAWDSS